MITGFNTDVEFDGRVFHVQTEEKGVDNPLVESLVYTGGEIVGSRKSSYADLVQNRKFPEAEVQKRMEDQHQAIIREIYSGRFDPDGPKPFGYNIITNRSLDEVVLEYLSGETGTEPIRIDLTGNDAFDEGSAVKLALRVVTDGSQRPVAGARVTVKLISSQDRPREIWSGISDTAGRIEVSLDLPAVNNGSSGLLCQAEADGAVAEVRQLIRRKPRP